MKIKTSELIGLALDWAVAKCSGVDVIRNFPNWAYIPKGKRSYYKWLPSTNWKQGGPIIEREGIEIRRGNPLYFPQGNEKGDYYEPLWLAGKQHGRTPLIAAMRCYCCARLGEEIDIPQELQPCQQPNL